MSSYNDVGIMLAYFNTLNYPLQTVTKSILQSAIISVTSLNQVTIEIILKEKW